MARTGYQEDEDAEWGQADASWEPAEADYYGGGSKTDARAQSLAEIDQLYPGKEDATQDVDAAPGVERAKPMGGEAFDKEHMLVYGVPGSQRSARAQSLAEIDRLYPPKDVAMQDTAGGVERGTTTGSGASDVEPLMHGTQQDSSHVDPAAASVAQAEPEAKPSTAAAPEAEQALRVDESEGPEFGTVQEGTPAEAKAPAHEGLPASPEAALSGAAQALAAVADEAATGPGHAAAPAAAATAAPAAAATAAPAVAATAAPTAAAQATAVPTVAAQATAKHAPVAESAEHAAKPAAAKVAVATAENHVPTSTPTVAPTPKTVAPAIESDSFAGAEDIHGKESDSWAAYTDSHTHVTTHGWNLGGTHGVKHSGGDASAAIYAISNVEGRYDSVQTYDNGILSFGILQWTLHAGSLQKFLGFLKDKSGPEGRAAFQDDFVAKGIDVKPVGGQYELSYNGKSFPLAAGDKGRAAIDQLVREDKASARKWAELFHTAGADPRVQKAQFECAKAGYHEAAGVRFGEKIVEQSLAACKNTFHAKYRSLYGQAESWMTASPKAAVLFFSMRDNNPKYANAAFLKAIDAFYDAYGTDKTKWPANWGIAFGDLVAAKSSETLASWGKQEDPHNEGRVDKTLRFWNKAHGKDGSAPNAAQTPVPHKTGPATSHANAAAKPADAKHDSVLEKLRARYASLMKQLVRGQIDPGEVTHKLIAYDQEINGGLISFACIGLLPVLASDLAKIILARGFSQQAAPKTAPTPAHVATSTPARTAKSSVATPVHGPAAVSNTLGSTNAMRAATAAPVLANGSAVHKVYELPDLPSVHVFVPPGGVKGAVEVFLFLHGKFAHHSGDPHPEEDMHLAQAMAQTNRNLVTLAPAAQLGGKDGEWPMWAKLAGQGHTGYKQIIAQSLERLSAELQPKPDPPVTLGSVSIAGHSAGGTALGEAADQLRDSIHDMTMQDGGYSGGAFDASHAAVIKWLLTGETDKTLRVIVHGNINTQSEGQVLKSNLNPKAIESAAKALHLKEVTVSTENGNQDPRSVEGMYLDHRLHVHGLKALRTVSVFNMPKERGFKGHMNVRDKTTEHLITEGRDTDFAGSGAMHRPVAPIAAPTPAAKHEIHAAPAPAAHGSAHIDKLAADGSAGEQAKQQIETVKKLAASSHAATPTDGKAFHDGGKEKELGAGDEAIEVLNNQEHIVPVFPATPDGMVMAALYELHRGDKRSMAEIMADHSAAHWQHGEDAAVEQTTKGDWKHGRGLNDDGDATKHGQVVGHAAKAKGKGQLIHLDSPVGPIQAYKTSAGMGTFSQGKDPMWCGAFVTFCLARCGIDVGTLKYVPAIGSALAKYGGTLFSFGYTQLDDGGGDAHKAKYSYQGGYSEGNAGDTQKKLQKKELHSAEGIDIRPGDIFYSHKHTGIIVGVNKQPNQIVLRTIEGNSGDAVVSNVKTVEVDKKGVVTSAPFWGWGRPAPFGAFAAPINEEWIHSGKDKKHDEGKTT